MSFRPSTRLFSTFRPFFRKPLHGFQRRAQSSVPPAAEQSGFAKLWNSPVGPKTVHFWAPIMKWALVLTGASDFWRPASSLSLTQNLALMSTGAIWTRWCFIIRPKNLFLAAVNFFLFLVGSTQVARILMYRRSVEGVEEVVKQEVGEVRGGLEGVKGEVEGRVKRV